MSFKARDSTGWTTRDGAPAKFTVADGIMVLRTGNGDTGATQTFRDAQIHVGFNIAEMPDASGWARGNSGVIVQNRYEVRVLDSYQSTMGGACSNFDVAAPFVEWMLLGVISLRYEGKLEYDPEKMRITNNADANKLVKPVFRKGWEPHAVKA